MTKVKEDALGIYVRAGGYVFRPGADPVEAVAYRMDDGGLKAGDEVKVRHMSQSCIGRLTRADGQRLYWYAYEAAGQGTPYVPYDQDITSRYGLDGLRKYD